MARYRIVQDGTGWAVRKNGRRRFKKTYPTQALAEQAARRDASVGDSIQIQRLNGTFGREDTVGTPGPGGDR